MRDAIKEGGLRIPGDIAVVGFDNRVESRTTCGPVSPLPSFSGRWAPGRREFCLTRSCPRGGPLVERSSILPQPVPGDRS